jgi:anti-anti-sigma factor
MMGSTPCADRDLLARPSTETTRPIVNVDDQAITILVDSGDEIRVVKIAGEVDLASRALVIRRCTEGRARDVVVDLSEVTFLDSGGCRAFAAARTALEQHHRTLTLAGAVGQPRRLLDLIRHIELPAPSC